MKHCSYCGQDNPDDAELCTGCGTNQFAAASPVVAPQESGMPKLQFKPLAPGDMDKDLVTLTTCGTLLEADLIVSRLEAAGIPVIIPDQFLMQTIAFNLNTFGYVRVQVSPKDYDVAKELLSSSADTPPPTAV